MNTGCKNFTRLHDFRDKPEATKCIKCRQRGRQNYFAKKGRGDAPASLLPPTGKLRGVIEGAIALYWWCLVSCGVVY
tara:strand:- start:4 stop:234 length:231 start_codon:yes stop_codon:yes gene_type:complete